MQRLDRLQRFLMTKGLHTESKIVSAMKQFKVVTDPISLAVSLGLLPPRFLNDELEEGISEEKIEMQSRELEKMLQHVLDTDVVEPEQSKEKEESKS